MPVFYLESSGHFKRYRTEPGTDVVNALFERRGTADVFVASRLSIIEMEAAAARGVRGRTLTPQAQGAMLRRFAEDMATVLVLSVSPRTLTLASHMARNHGLRA